MSNKTLNAIVVCGPSGVGKGTLLKKLLADYSKFFAYSVSHTTRKPREGEENGREYHFSQRDDVIRMRDNGEFLELCEVHGNFYGTSFAAIRSVQEQGKTCLVEIDVQGAQKVKDASPKENLNASYLFITAPLEELRKRIIGRGADDEETVRIRLQTATKEFDFVRDHPDFFDQVIVNDNVDEAYRRLIEAINAEFKKYDMAPLPIV